ncbi:MAG: hypothetical protein JWO03_726 [Bacteroidetes bacterium]|nr:hypothetical protein [Bacteroidota bacterium]
MKKKILKPAFIVILLIAGSALFAQPGGGGGGSGGGGTPPPGTGAPIDGGSIAFLAGVVGYVYFQLRQQQQKPTA